jgi:multimeric flavodoxin WrbA
MKILGINGSPRKEASNTRKLLQAVLEGAAEQGAETELIDIADRTITFCSGCLTCYTTGSCIFDDDAQEIFALMQEADGIVLGSPVYILSITGQLKQLLDRLTDAIHCQMLSEKYGCSVVTTGGSSDQEVLAYLNRTLNMFGVTVVGGERVAMASGPEAFQAAVVDSRALGRNLAEAIATKRRYPEQEAVLASLQKLFCHYAEISKDTYPHQYDFWVEKGEIHKEG